MHVQIEVRSLVQVLILTHPTVGWKTINSSNNTHKPEFMEYSGRQGSMGSAEV